MSDKEIAYDVKLEDELEEIKLKMWINEELQIQPIKFHSKIKETYFKFLNLY
ncbi:MAG: hypothetical protein ACFFBI_10605 [Promethearchaeota archaeon]